jgi:hypothetical protein
MQNPFAHLFFLTSKGTYVTALAESLRGIRLHLDNPQADNTKRSRQEIARTRATKVVHLRYSPDDAPSDFFMFDRLNRGITGFTASSPDDILSEIGRILAEIPQDVLAVLYNEWFTKIEWIIKHK